MEAESGFEADTAGCSASIWGEWDHSKGERAARFAPGRTLLRRESRRLRVVVEAEILDRSRCSGLRATVSGMWGTQADSGKAVCRGNEAYKIPVTLQQMTTKAAKPMNNAFWEDSVGTVVRVRLRRYGEWTVRGKTC